MIPLVPVFTYFIVTTPDPDPEDCEDNPSYAQHCTKFQWACKDTRYPWFKEHCKKTCMSC